MKNFPKHKNAKRYVGTAEDFAGNFLDISGIEVGPLKQLIELYKNAIEAQATQITITADKYYQTLYGVNKFTMVDNGVGMSRETMEAVYSVVGQSSKSTGIGLNYGVGGRLSTAYYNPLGVEVRTWHKNGRGYMLRVVKEQGTNRYYLHPFTMPNGEVHYIVDMDMLADSEMMKHASIGQHGTMVILLGDNLEHDTTLPPKGYDIGLPSWWVSRTLNSQILDVPQDVRFICDFESHQQKNRENKHRNIYGLRHPVLSDAISSGSLTMEHGTLDWYILDEERFGKEYNYGRTLYNIFDKKNSAGHVAVTLNGEIMECFVDDDGIQALARFGVIAGAERIAIHVNLDATLYAMNMSRTLVTKRDGSGDIQNGRIISQFAKTFVQNMPQEIDAFVNENRDENSDSLNDFVRTQVLKNLENIHYRKNNILKEVEKNLSGSEAKTPKVKKNLRTGVARGSQNVKRENRSFFSDPVYKEDCQTGKDITEMIPTFEWSSISDDVAGWYLSESNKVLMNKNFGPYRSMMNYGLSFVTENIRHKVISTIEGIVQRGISASLGSAILNARINYEHKPGWAGERYEALVGEMGITSICISEMLNFGKVKRQMDSDPFLKTIMVSKNYLRSTEAAA